MDHDIFARMEDVELLAELRRIAHRAGHRGDAPTADHAGRLFAAFYERRLQRAVPEGLWRSTRAFVRQHAG
jgi:hypothetical protein